MANLSQITDKKIRNIVKTLLSELKLLSPYIYHVSRWNSVYLKFKDIRLCSVRIGDHNGREKYRYKWNIEVDGKTRIDNDNNARRFYFSDSDLNAFILRIKQYKTTIDNNDYNT